MKKLYSIVLMAAALLIGTNAWAQNTISVVYHNGTTPAASFSDLQTAINSVAAGDSATITLGADLDLAAGVLIPQLTDADNVDGKRIADRAPQRICINLNGHNITTLSTTTQCAFALMKGVLRFDGQGKVERYKQAKGGTNWHRGTILVSGTDGDKNDASADRSKQEWSVLYIGKDVTIYSGGEDTYGIGIQDLGNTYPNWGGFKMAYAGYKTKYTAAEDPMYSPTAGADQWSAFGVKLMIEGTVYGEYRGINVLGNINQTPSKWDGATGRSKSAYPYYNHNFPYICVGATANVSCRPANINDTGNGGIYLGGWAVVDVHGTVHGQTGIMAKAGDVKLIDGTVYSDCTTAANSGNYHATVAGSGIFITSSASYAGETSVAVTGDSYVAGAGGSAIIDVCATSTKEQTNTAVTHVAITGGTIEAGDQGAISLGTGTSNVTDITGGNVSGVIDIGDASDESQRFHTDVTTLLPNNDDYHTTTVTVPDPEDPSKTKTVVVVSEGEAPTPANSVIAAAQNTSVNWQNTTTKEETLNADLTLTELEINQAYAQKLTIASGKSLTVGRVVLGSNAQIVVEAGAKFIVTGEHGIVAPVAENIVLKSTATNYATFLFNPAVTSNRHPNATVEYTAVKSFYASATSYQWERFGIPTHNTLTSIECTTTDVWTNIQIFENNAWQDLGWLQNSTFANTARLNKPFIACNLLTERAKTDPAATYVMKGELVGNTDAALNANLEWNPFSNSYTADVDVTALLAGLASGTNVDPTVYLATPTGLGTYSWDAVDPKWVTSSDKVAPMQAFILHNHGTVSEVSTLNYKNMLWTPATSTSAGAPRRFASADDNTARLRVIVANEQGVWDNVKMTECTVNLHNAAKYMNDDVNIYAMADEKAAIVAAENLENTYVGFSTVNGGKFTISFANVEGREFTLIDHETGAEVLMVEGNTYDFTADANSANDYRFEIVSPRKVTTAIENAEAVKSAKGIYTITGQYMGEMNVWNSLPAGVYVVNGEKRVK